MFMFNKFQSTQKDRHMRQFLLHKFFSFNKGSNFKTKSKEKTGVRMKV